MNIRMIRLLGAQVHEMTASDIVNVISESVRDRAKHIVANHNLHSIFLCQGDPVMRRFYQRSSVCFIDGMPLVILGRLQDPGISCAHRNTSLDWMKLLLPLAAQNKWRIFYLGSTHENVERGANFLRRLYPGLILETHHGYLGGTHSEMSEIALTRIRQHETQILFVGMGMPVQEHWIEANLERIDSHAIVTMGAYMDYIAGSVPTPPRFLGRWGLEGIYRLVTEPRRLGRRYLVEPLKLFKLWFLGKLQEF